MRVPMMRSTIKMLSARHLPLDRPTMSREQASNVDFSPYDHGKIVRPPLSAWRHLLWPACWLSPAWWGAAMISPNWRRSSPRFYHPALQADETAGLNPTSAGLSAPSRRLDPGYGGQGDQAPQHLAWSGRWTPRWQADIGSGSQKDKVLLVSQPTSMGEAVFTLDSQGVVQATNLKNGAQLWRQKAVTDGGDAVAQGGLVLTDRLVIAVLGDGQVRALNQSDGAVVWQQRLPNPVRLSPQADDGHVYVATIDNSLYALNLSDGRITWETRGLGKRHGCYARAA
jgi:outer membrane protein assembly factor BamB